MSASAFPPLPSLASIRGYRLSQVHRGTAEVHTLDGIHCGSVWRENARKLWWAQDGDSEEIPGGPWGTQHLAARAVVRHREAGATKANSGSPDDELAAENAALRPRLGALRRHHRSEVHHVNGDLHDNRLENLRVVELPRAKEKR